LKVYIIETIYIKFYENLKSLPQLCKHKHVIENLRIERWYNNATSWWVIELWIECFSGKL
jgi:hypothetical protein